MGGTDGRTDGEKRGWGGRGMGAAMGMEADLGSLRPTLGSSLPPPPPSGSKRGGSDKNKSFILL